MHRDIDTAPKTDKIVLARLAQIISIVIKKYIKTMDLLLEFTGCYVCKNCR